MLYALQLALVVEAAALARLRHLSSVLV